MTETRKGGHGSYGVVAKEELIAQSGLDFLRGMQEGRYPMPPMSGVIPVEPVSVELGRIVFKGVPEPRFYNPIGSIHGGYAATLLDTAMGCAVHSTLAAGQAYTTLELKVNYVRALSDRVGPIFVEGNVIHAARQIATAEGRVTDGEGRLYAHATTTCMLFTVD